jgi:adenosylhomocysteine nucleosidase
MMAPTTDIPQCDLLLFVATESEYQALKESATLLGITFDSHESGLGDYYDMGTIGLHRVLAIRTRIGSFKHGGPASRAITFQAATGATGVIQLGMAFGLSRKMQGYGQVLVSASLFPYDEREVHDGPVEPIVSYARTKRWLAHPGLISMLKREILRERHSFRVEVGTLLSGGARISSSRFRDNLAASVPPGPDPIIGGEMEGIGLLAVAPADRPIWIVVKGISDFADGDSTTTIDSERLGACRNAAEFVLSALINDAHDRRGQASRSQTA